MQKGLRVSVPDVGSRSNVEASNALTRNLVCMKLGRAARQCARETQSSH